VAVVVAAVVVAAARWCRHRYRHHSHQ